MRFMIRNHPTADVMFIGASQQNSFWNFVKNVIRTIGGFLHLSGDKENGPAWRMATCSLPRGGMAFKILTLIDQFCIGNGVDRPVLSGPMPQDYHGSPSIDWSAPFGFTFGTTVPVGTPPNVVPLAVPTAPGGWVIPGTFPLGTDHSTAITPWVAGNPSFFSQQGSSTSGFVVNNTGPSGSLPTPGTGSGTAPTPAPATAAPAAPTAAASLPTPVQLPTPSGNVGRPPACFTEDKCPKCGSAQFDNRAWNEVRLQNGERKVPDTKCCNIRCGHIVWNVPVTATPTAGGGGGGLSMPPAPEPYTFDADTPLGATQHTYNSAPTAAPATAAPTNATTAFGNLDGSDAMNDFDLGTPEGLEAARHAEIAFERARIAAGHGAGTQRPSGEGSSSDPLPADPLPSPSAPSASAANTIHNSPPAAPAMPMLTPVPEYEHDQSTRPSTPAETPARKRPKHNSPMEMKEFRRATRSSSSHGTPYTEDEEDFICFHLIRRVYLNREPGSVSMADFVRDLIDTVEEWEEEEAGACPLKEAHRTEASVRAKLKRLLSGWNISDWYLFAATTFPQADLPDYLSKFLPRDDPSDDDDDDIGGGGSASCPTSTAVPVLTTA